MINSNSSSAQRLTGTQTIRMKFLLLLCCVLGLTLILAACSGGNPQPSPSSTSSQVNYPPVDNISCDNGEHSNYHIHVHLTIYINGNPVTVPGQIGIAPDGSCIYWLHTHDDSGIIHVEAPNSVDATLSNFLNIWRQEFADSAFPQELTQSGWYEYVNGQAVNDIRSIPLQEHDLITLLYNSPDASPDTSYNWPNGL